MMQAAGILQNLPHCVLLVPRPLQFFPVLLWHLPELLENGGLANAHSEIVRRDIYKVRRSMTNGTQELLQSLLWLALELGPNATPNSFQLFLARTVGGSLNFTIRTGLRTESRTMINLDCPRTSHELKISTLLWHWLLENEPTEKRFPTAPSPCLVLTVRARRSSTVFLDDLNLKNYVEDETPASYELVAFITDDHSMKVLNKAQNWTLGWMEYRHDILGIRVAPSVETRTVTFSGSCVAIYMRSATLPEPEPLSSLPVECNKMVCIREKMSGPKLQEDLWNEEMAKVNLGDIRGPPIQAYDVRVAKSSVEL